MNRSCRGIAAVVLAAGVGGLFACGGEESSKQCLAVQVYVPPTDKFPDLDPFKDCTSVEVCYTDPDTGKLEGCQNVLYGMAGSAAVESLPYGDEVLVVATCYLQQVDTQGATTVTAVSVGQTCPVKQDSECDTPANKYLYMGAINKFLPTVDPMAGAVTNPYESRWGATVTTLYDGKVLLAGGAGPEGKFDWADTTKLQNIKSSAEIYDPGNGTFTMVGTAPQQLMSEKRAFAAAVEVTSGQIAIFGGMKDSTQSTSSVDLYDPISMTFTAGPPMKDTRAYHTATALDYGEAGIYVLLVGGMGSGEGTWEVWDPLTGVVASGPLA